VEGQEIRGFTEDREDVFDVGSACDLGDYAAISGMQFDLAGDDIGAHVEPVHHDGRGGFVACGLDAQNDGHKN
jgi:hypothetical protein